MLSCLLVCYSVCSFAFLSACLLVGFRACLFPPASSLLSPPYLLAWVAFCVFASLFALCFSTAKSSYDSIQIGFYSCHDPFLEDNEVEAGAWKGMARIADELDMVIGGGDQVYVDNSEGCTDLWLFLRDHQESIEKRFLQLYD